MKAVLGDGVRVGRMKRERVASELRSLILRGGLRDGDQLPSEPELARRLGVARITLRRAADELISERVLERRHGLGTFVRAPVRTQFGLLVGHRALTPETSVFWQWVVRFARAWAGDHGAEACLYVLREDGHLDEAGWTAVRERRIQAALLIAIAQEASELRDGLLRRLGAAGVPAIGFMKTEPEGLRRVNVNLEQILDSVVARLVTEGHRDIGLAGVTPRTLYVPAAIRAAERHGARIAPEWRIAGALDGANAVVRGRSVFEQWEALPNRPGAMLFFDHYYAMGFMHAQLSRLGRVPDAPRVALIEAKNTALSLPWPVLRAQFDATPVVRRAMETLAALAEGRDTPLEEVMTLPVEWDT